MSHPNLVAKHELQMMCVRDENDNMHSLMISASFFNNLEPEIEKNAEILNHNYENTEKGRHAHLK